MKRLLATTLISALALAAADGARAQAGGRTQTKGQAPVNVGRLPPVAAQGEVPVSQGRLEGGTYTNDFFRISFSTPRGWVAQDMATRQALLESGKKIFEEGKGTAKEKTGMEASMQRTVFLLSVSKYDLSAPPPGAFNAQLSFLAERIPTAVIKTGGDYLTQMMRVAKISSATLELTGPIRTERVGRVSFAAADAKLTIGASVVAQKYFATVRDGYALLFAFSYVDETDVQAFEELIKSVRFK
ncbi:MAG: hypothetical protein ABW208_09015 [Pyrinomonadaceae bacterium]